MSSSKGKTEKIIGIHEIDEEKENTLENGEEDKYDETEDCEGEFDDEGENRSHYMEMKLKISKELTKRVINLGSDTFTSPFVNAIISGNVGILEHLISQGLSCPLKDLKICYSLAAGYHDEKIAEVMLDMIQSAGKACMGDVTQEFPPCKGCMERIRKEAIASGKSKKFF